MVTTIFVTVCILRVLLIWQMVELLKHIKTPRNNAIATMGFLIYVFYLALNTFSGVGAAPEAILRLIGLILMLIGANRCFTIKEQKE